MGNCCSTEKEGMCPEIKNRTPRNGFRSAVVGEYDSHHPSNPFKSPEGYNQPNPDHHSRQYDHFHMVNTDLTDFNQVSRSQNPSAFKSTITMSRLMTGADTGFAAKSGLHSSFLPGKSQLPAKNEVAFESQVQAVELANQTSAMHKPAAAVKVTIEEIPSAHYGLEEEGEERGPFDVTDGGTYTGQVKEGKMNGRGTWIGPDGDYYYGYWKDNLRQGKGRYISIKGDVFDGEWRAGCKEGKGLLQRLNGYLYRGQWLEDLPHGKGYEREAGGAVYEGEFIAGARHGEGTLNDAKLGINYKGSFRDGVYEGQGTRI